MGYLKNRPLCIIKPTGVHKQPSIGVLPFHADEQTHNTNATKVKSPTLRKSCFLAIYIVIETPRTPFLYIKFVIVRISKHRNVTMPFSSICFATS